MSTEVTDVVSYQAGNRFVYTPGAAMDVEDEDCCIIKGFVSVQTPDRSNDLVKPEAFDIASYMAQPAVLVNHQLWTNRQGNQVGVGVPISLHVVKVRTSDAPGMWSIYDVDAKKEVDSFPKDRNPNIGIGTRGLYAFIKITDPDVVEKIKDGELTGFSWRGLSKPQYVHDEKSNQTHKSYSYIDLLEITLATAPDNRASSFVVLKDAIHSYRFDKDYCTKTFVEEQLRREKANDFSIIEDDSTYFAYDPSREVNERNLLVVKMAGGMSVIIGKPKPESTTSILRDEERNQLLTAIAKSKEIPMATATTQAPPTPATEEEDKSKTTPTAPAEPTTPVATPFNMEEFITKAVSAVLEKVNPILDTLAGNVQALALTQQDLVSKMAAASVPEEPVAPPAPAIEQTQLLEVQKKLETFASTLESVQKSLGGVVPLKAPRSETVPVPPKQPVTPPNPNDVFNNLFGA